MTLFEPITNLWQYFSHSSIVWEKVHKSPLECVKIHMFFIVAAGAAAVKECLFFLCRSGSQTSIHVMSIVVAKYECLCIFPTLLFRSFV